MQSQEFILVVGASGFLGHYILKYAKDLGYRTIAFCRTKPLFFCDDFIKTESYLDLNVKILPFKPKLIINCVAIANHILCTQDPNLAYRINSKVPYELAKLCSRLDIRFVHISTDAVYEGCRNPPFDEECEAIPLSSYAITKYFGEQLIAEHELPHLIIRTNFFGIHPDNRGIFNFFLTNLAKNIRVDGYVNYSVSSIYIESLVKAIFDLIKDGIKGIVNVGSSNALSKYSFGSYICDKLGKESHLIKKAKIKTSFIELSNQLDMNVQKAESCLGYKLPSTESGIDECLSLFYNDEDMRRLYVNENR